ncbi:MAG: NAD(P)H-hydrate dehydratase [Dehalococcoidales bacterium]|nr:NAD(P)H-hydrate dehydratase [Dehalococcoidales bacterium]
MKICRVQEIRELDRQAGKLYGIPAAILMENAGSAVYQVIRRETAVAGSQCVVLCGPGNNGGDGFVVARLLQANGAQVKVFTFSGTSEYRNEAKQNLEILTRFPVSIASTQSITKIKTAIRNADFIVDALLGTGVDRPITGIMKKVSEVVNGSGKKVFAVDIPSGINGDTGQEMGTSIKADFTVTFGLPKAGNLLFPGYERSGKLYLSHLSFPTTLTDNASLKIQIPEPAAIPARKPEANKFDFGPALVIAGAANYYWAPYASAYAFLKTGGGYVYLACPKSLIKAIARQGKEIVFQPQAETKTGSIAYTNKAELLELAQKTKIVVIGPGLSLDEETQHLVRELVKEIEKPMLIDGDGISAIARQPEILRTRNSPTILTPHVGEMSRLTGKKSEVIINDRIGILQATATHLNAYIALKGPHTLIGCPDGRVNINVTGKTERQAGMATAGAGDVLNGTIAAMFCLGLGIDTAVNTGVYIHGLAGDLAAKEKGPDGMTATDILNTLPAAVKYYREYFKQLAVDHAATIQMI